MCVCARDAAKSHTKSVPHHIQARDAWLCDVRKLWCLIKISKVRKHVTLVNRNGGIDYERKCDIWIYTFDEWMDGWIHSEPLASFYVAIWSRYQCQYGYDAIKLAVSHVFIMNWRADGRKWFLYCASECRADSLVFHLFFTNAINENRFSLFENPTKVLMRSHMRK